MGLIGGMHLYWLDSQIIVACFSSVFSPQQIFLLCSSTQHLRLQQAKKIQGFSCCILQSIFSKAQYQLPSLTALSRNQKKEIDKKIGINWAKCRAFSL